MNYLLSANKLILFSILICRIGASQSCPTFTNSLPIQVGYNYSTGSNYSSGSTDPNWIVVSDNLVSTSEPREANLTSFITQYPCSFNDIVASGNTGAGYVFGSDPIKFQFKFCISQLSSPSLAFSICGDDYVTVKLNGNYIIGANANGVGTVVNNLAFFNVGLNVIEIELSDINQGLCFFKFNGTLTNGTNSILYPTCSGDYRQLYFNDNNYSVSNIPVFNVCKNQSFNLTISDISPSISYLWEMGDATQYYGSSLNHSYNSPGNYTIKVTPQAVSCFEMTPLIFSIIVSECLMPQCDKCIGSFAPTPGDYILSCWVKEDHTTGAPPINFSSSGIKVSFVGDPTIYGPFYPNNAKNAIINGWQKVEANFSVPPSAIDMKIALINNSSSTSNPVDVYFDDIRVHPIDAAMKSYIYDPVSLRLMAELDDNNYATYYEYNENGELTRVRKETEKGVFTIKESRKSAKK